MQCRLQPTTFNYQARIKVGVDPVGGIMGMIESHPLATRKRDKKNNKNHHTPDKRIIGKITSNKYTPRVTIPLLQKNARNIAQKRLAARPALAELTALLQSRSPSRIQLGRKGGKCGERIEGISGGKRMKGEGKGGEDR